MENSDKKNLWSWIKKNSRLMKIFFFSLLIVFFDYFSLLQGKS